MTQASNVGILTPKINSSGQLDATTGLTGAVPVANGGTGAATYTANNVLLGNGTSAFQTVAPSTNGNVLTSNGTTWVSSAPAGGGGLGGMQVFTASGTFTIPSGKTVVKVTVIGGGGGSRNGVAALEGSGAGGGGSAIKYLTGLTPGNTLTVTRGAGGGTATSGGTSSVSSGTQTITTISATGGSAGVAGAQIPGSNGGTGSGGDLNVNGGGGGCAASYACSSNYILIAGGGTILGLPQYSLLTSTQAPLAGQAYGAGAGAAIGTQANASGANGVVIFEY